MNTIITTKHFHADDSLESMVQKKVHKLTKYFRPDTQINVKLSTSKKQNIAEITIFVDGMVFRSEEIGDDMLTCVEHAIHKMERQIARNKSRLAHRLRKGDFQEEEVDLLDSEELEPQKVVRTKRFSIKPLEIEEAAMQMELLDHSFYVFRNAATNEINVIYKRNDGQLGLIEPEYV